MKNPNKPVSAPTCVRKAIAHPAAGTAILACLLLSLPPLATAQPQPSHVPDPVDPDSTTSIKEPEAGSALYDTHANREASNELLQLAALEPERFIGKTLVLQDGEMEVTVGPVLDLRRRLQNEGLYLIVDATAYFNTAVEYAVAIEDVGRMEETRLVIPEAPGMHLRGIEYYPDDYADL